MRGHITKRPSGSYAVVLYLGRDANGKKKQKWVTVQGNKKDAERLLAELLAQAHNGSPIDAGKETVSDFMERWLRDTVAIQTRPRTLQSYSTHVRLHIDPVIGKVKMQKLAPADIQAVIAGVLERGLSSTTARRVYATLHRALVCALKWGIVYRNVCDVVDAPREAEYEYSTPDNATVNRLIDSAMETPYGVAFHLLASTGMRRGEVCALRWDQVDLDKGTLSITGAVGRENGALVISSPKSATSRRMIHIGETTVRLLQGHRAEQAEYRLKLGGVFEDNGLVFTSPTGGLMEPGNLTKTWIRTCRDTGVHYRLHDLRHHHATALIENGVHIKAVQNRLGHSSPSLTMKIYAHVSPQMDKEAAEAYDRAMAAAD